MEIKSSLLNDKDFVEVKKSLIEMSLIDGQEKYRVKTLEYINDSSDDNNDMFFYDMLEFVRFLNPSNKEDIAYTTPSKLIYLNCPCDKIKNVRQWDFTYDHECLHQLWDTFGVAKKIEDNGKEYNHYILNVASDCVINDYLYFNRKKEMPENLITPEYIKSKFGVDYDRKVDTQYTLYLKLLEVKDKIEKDQETKERCGDENHKDGESSQQGQSGGQGESSSGEGSSNSSSSQGGSGSSSQNKKSAKDQAQDSAKNAQDAADKAKEAAGDDKSKQEAAKKAQQAADKAKEEAKKAKEADEKGDGKAAKEHADAAKKAEQEAKDAAKEAGVKDQGKGNQEGDKKDGNQKDDKGGKEAGHDDNEDTPQESEVDLEEIKKKANKVIEKYKNKIAGDFGKFIAKCKASQELKKSGLSIGTYKGAPGWNQQMNSYINTYVKKKVFQKKREWEATYSRVKRGSGYVEYGQPIQPGRKIKEEKLTINVAFYIDRSGSMSGCIQQVFKACYIISESLKKQFSKEKVVDEVSFKVYAFNDFMKEIKYGNQADANGGTMSFDSILNFIVKNTDNFMINVIITDAGFSIDKGLVKDFMKDVSGMILFITNEESTEMKELSKQYNTQLFYIKADHDFTIDK